MIWTAERVAALRAETPGCSARIHFNNAGAGLMPSRVVDAIKAHIDLETRIGGYEASDAQADAITTCYDDVAALINAQPRNIGFVENATVAFAQALSAIVFEPGDVLLTTTNDYVSNQIMFIALARRFDIEVVRAPDTPTGEVDVDGIDELIRTRRPRLVAVTHVPTNSGLVQPVLDIGAVCRRHDCLYLVDGCQSVGQRVIDVQAIGCDFFSATSRKFLRGPRGAGFLYASDRVLDQGMEPLYIDMQGAIWTTPDTYEPVSTARRFENWEFAYALVLGTGEAVRYAAGVGLDDIEQRVTALAEQLREGLTDMGLRVLDRGADRCGIVTVEVPNWDGAAFHAALEERRINSAVSERIYGQIDFSAKGVEWAIRLSPHYYNTEEEVDTVVEAVSDLVGSG